jgi:hypothetical protein
MKEMMVYHWWSEPSDRPPHLNLRSPLIHSIATLRGVNKELPVVVLDGSSQRVDYGGWDRKLKFLVIPITFSLSGYQDKAGWRNLSRMFDVWKYVNTDVTVIYSDLDVFWLKDPLPLVQNSDKFCFNKFNSGFFYFNRLANDVYRFFKIFEAYTITALNDDNFRVITRSYTDYNEWYYVLDETILTYMYVKMPELFNVVDIYEHLTPSSDCSDILAADPDGMKMFHCHGMIVENKLEIDEWRRRHNRGLAPVLIKELYDNMRISIGDRGIEELYGPSWTNAPKVSLKDKEFVKRLLSTKKDGGLFNLTEAM